MSKKQKSTSGVVYSTNPDFVYDKTEESPMNILPGFQVLRVGRESKGRGGKEVTIVKGFKGIKSELQDICDLLKKKCGAGGTVDDQDIIIQGDKRDLIVSLLIKEGFNNTKKI